MCRLPSHSAWATRVITWAASLIALTAIAACQFAAAQPFLVAVSVPKSGDVVSVRAEGDRLILDIASAMGIGSARVHILSEALPTAIELRMQLKALEELRFTYDERTILVSVQSYGDYLVRQAVQVDGAEPRTITSESPYWMQTDVVTSDTSAPAHLIVVQAPTEFLRTGQRSFDLSWVDFYR